MCSCQLVYRDDEGVEKGKTHLSDQPVALFATVTEPSRAFAEEGVGASGRVEFAGTVAELPGCGSVAGAAATSAFVAVVVHGGRRPTARWLVHTGDVAGLRETIGVELTRHGTAWGVCVARRRATAARVAGRGRLDRLLLVNGLAGRQRLLNRWRAVILRRALLRWVSECGGAEREDYDSEGAHDGLVGQSL